MIVDHAKNRSRIAVIVVLAVINYCIAAMIGAAVTVFVVSVVLLFKIGEFPSSLDGFEYLGIGLGVVVVAGGVFGGLSAVVRIPTLRRKLEDRVLTESHAVIVGPDVLPRVRNLLDGLAIAAGIPSPRFAVVDDPAPNSFGVGTKPEDTVIGVTTGLIDSLSRDELEAILAYEITRVASFDVALASWTAALTGGAATVADQQTAGIFGAPSRHLAQRLQTWALRGLGRERDEAAIAVSRNPASLVHALERLAADPARVASISSATAPLWIEVPDSLAGVTADGKNPALGPLLLSERIAALREMAHLPPAPAPAPAPEPEPGTIVADSN